MIVLLQKQFSKLTIDLCKFIKQYYSTIWQGYNAKNINLKIKTSRYSLLKCPKRNAQNDL